MADDSSQLTGADFEKGIRVDEVADGGMVQGHAGGEAVLVARRGAEFFAIGATCTHYGGELAKGLMVDCTVRCPLHHARFDLRTGEAIAAPALNDVSCWKIEKRDDRVFVTGKIENKPVTRSASRTGAPAVSPPGLRRSGHVDRQGRRTSLRSTEPVEGLSGRQCTRRMDPAPPG